jgi:hypothetical protein
VADTGEGRSPVYPFVQSAQMEAGCGSGRQVRRKGSHIERTQKQLPSRGDREAKRYPSTLKGVLRHALTIELICFFAN